MLFHIIKKFNSQEKSMDKLILNLSLRITGYQLLKTKSELISCGKISPKDSKRLENSDTTRSNQVRLLNKTIKIKLIKNKPMLLPSSNQAKKLKQLELLLCNKELTLTRLLSKLKRNRLSKRKLIWHLRDKRLDRK